ncbi:MAG TPA: hypothetical protein DCE18_20930, partial [Syntrophobacteraceae bacterium]|nr:hypothetical protein [Syntrophobacteraceae bacterium]
KTGDCQETSKCQLLMAIDHDFGMDPDGFWALSRALLEVGKSLSDHALPGLRMVQSALCQNIGKPNPKVASVDWQACPKRFKHSMSAADLPAKGDATEWNRRVGE